MTSSFVSNRKGGSVLPTVVSILLNMLLNMSSLASIFAFLKLHPNSGEKEVNMNGPVLKQNCKEKEASRTHDSLFGFLFKRRPIQSTGGRSADVCAGANQENINLSTNNVKHTVIL